MFNNIPKLFLKTSCNIYVLTLLCVSLIEKETQSRVRTIDLNAKRRDEEERQKAERRDSEKDNDTESKPKGASIFGAAKPVDTSSREKEIDERLKKQNDSKSTRSVDRYVNIDFVKRSVE